MENPVLERYREDAQLRSEMNAAAKRERARVLKRFLEQASQALLGDSRKGARARIQREAAHARIQRVGPCPAC